MQNIAQRYRNAPRKLIAPETRQRQIHKIAHLSGQRPRQPVVVQRQRLQIDQIAYLRRYRPRQPIIAKLQRNQIGKAAYLRRYSPRQLIGREIQPLQPDQFLDRLVHRPRKLLIVKRQLRYAIRIFVIHKRYPCALPRVDAPIHRPVQLARADKRFLQGKQRRAIRHQPGIVIRIQHRHAVRALLLIPIRVSLIALAAARVKRRSAARARHQQRNRHHRHHRPQRNPRHNPNRPLSHNLPSR